VTLADRGQFLLEYIELLMNERVHEADGFRHTAPSQSLVDSRESRVNARQSRVENDSVGAELGPPYGRSVGSQQSLASSPPSTARGHDRWVINEVRALGSWYTKGLDNGSHLRTAINTAESLNQLRDIVSTFFNCAGAPPPARSYADASSRVASPREDAWPQALLIPDP
jgi:hypothetical protein